LAYRSVLHQAKHKISLTLQTGIIFCANFTVLHVAELAFPTRVQPIALQTVVAGTFNRTNPAKRYHFITGTTVTFLLQIPFHAKKASFCILTDLTILLAFLAFARKGLI
jgi:hypothetical protein